MRRRRTGNRRRQDVPGRYTELLLPNKIGQQNLTSAKPDSVAR
jgi:hypothetical protein